MTDRYALIGHPVSHSKSPLIHAAFARQTGQDIRFDLIEAPLDGFIETVADFFAMGGCGCNITLPFKEQAAQFANQLTPRAEQAGAVNTLWLDDDGVTGDNTDGIGLVRDLQRHISIAGRRILVLGAGGAARGAIGPLLDESPSHLTVANRSLEKAELLAGRFSSEKCQVDAVSIEDATASYDIIINATSASLAGAKLPLENDVLARAQLAYDMMYGAQPTVFLRQCDEAGVAICLDGAGMLIEQAAEAFWRWRGIRPDVVPVLADIRATLK